MSKRSPFDMALNDFSNSFARRSTADTFHPSFVTYCFSARSGSEAPSADLEATLEAMCLAALESAAKATERKHIIWRMWPVSSFEDGSHQIRCRVSME